MKGARKISKHGQDDGVDRWEIVDAAPDASLTDKVGGYFSYREHVCSFSTRRELAGISGVLIYALGDPLEIVGADGSAITLEAGQAFIGGVSDKTSLSRGLGEQHGIELSLSLPSLAHIAATPVSEIANTVAPLSDLIGAAADVLGQQLCEANSDERRFSLLDAFLIERFAEDWDVAEPVLWAMRRLAEENAPRSGDVANSIGWSRKHLSQKFQSVTGFSPDLFRRMARFERFVTNIKETPESDLAGLAFEQGYVDQAHLTREVRRFADITPGELRQRIAPNIGGVRDD